MNIFEPNELLLFILFFVPGFVSMKVYDILVPNESRSAASYVCDAVAYSTINFIVSAPIGIHFYQNLPHGLISWFFAFLFFLLVFPAVIAFLTVKLLASRFVKKHATGLVNRPWDIIFNNEIGACVMVHLKNGNKIIGIYGDRSAISYHPNEEQIFLEEVYKLSENGTLTRVPDTKGVIIMGSEIAMIELFDAGEENKSC